MWHLSMGPLRYLSRRALGADRIASSGGLSSDFEQISDKADLVQNTGVASVEITAADRTKCLDSLLGRLRRGQTLQTEHRPQPVLEGRVIPFDPVVQMLLRNVPDRVVRAKAGVPLADDLGVAMGLVSYDRQWLVEAHRLAGLA